MPVEVIAKIKPINNKGFAVADAKDIDVDDTGKRLDTKLRELENAVNTYPVADGTTNIEPDKYYAFGEVDGLSVNLVSVEDDSKLHEYCFEFTPKKNFTELTVTPAVKWVSQIQISAGKTHQVSIVRGIGVMVCA